MYTLFEEKLVVCPYNKYHQVSSIRIQKHLIKCQKQYPHIKLVSCFYNYSHKLKPEEVITHYETCPSKMILDGRLYYKEPEEPEQNPNPLDDDCSSINSDFDKLSMGTTCLDSDADLDDILEFATSKNKSLTKHPKLVSPSWKKDEDINDDDGDEDEDKDTNNDEDEDDDIELIKPPTSSSEELLYAMCIPRYSSSSKPSFLEYVESKKESTKSSSDDFFKYGPSKIESQKSPVRDNTESTRSDSISAIEDISSIKTDLIDENGFVVVTPDRNWRLKKLCGQKTD